MNYLNYLKTAKCPECENTNIKYDYNKKEYYCSRCGLILIAPAPTTKKQLDYIFSKIAR